MGHAVFRQYRKPIARNERWNSVVDFRIHVIRPSCKHDARIPRLLKPFNRLFALFAHILLKAVKRLIGSVRGLLRLLLCYAVFSKFLHDLCRHKLPLVKCNKEINKFNFTFLQHIHVALDYLRIRCDNRTIIVIVGIPKFLAFKGNTGIEYFRYAFFREVFNMPVNKLCRIADRIG